MGKVLKRFQYLGLNEETHKPEVMWTEWFPWNHPDRPKIQLKGRTTLYNEYKEV